jgi:GTP cyclohydrolase I
MSMADDSTPLQRALRDADRDLRASADINRISPLVSVPREALGEQETPLQRSLREGTIKNDRPRAGVRIFMEGNVLPETAETQRKIRQAFANAGWPLLEADLSVDERTPEAAAESGVRQLLDLVADDPTRSGLEDTPARVVRAYQEMTAGYDVDIEDLLLRQFDEIPYGGMVILRHIDFVSLCEHHLLPFTGTASVAYIPADDSPVVGLSKLARLVDAYARRLQVQERLTTQITTALDTYVQTQGSACVLKASHSCMTIRGAKKAQAEMVTSSLTGAFHDDPATRAEFLALAQAAS